MNTKSIGNKGENIAAKYLAKQGYKVLQRNYNCHYGEVDIVAKDGDYIVFVEVKSRTSTAFCMPREAVDWHKQQRIINCAKSWLVANKKYGSNVRFDVAEVLNGEVTLLKDAFRIG